MNFARVLSSIAVAALAALPLAAAQAKTGTEIDTKVDAALVRFKQDVQGADDYLKAAKGVLVMPEVKKAGLVVGGQWGEGALRVDGKTAAYYRMDAGSVGFQAGYQEANFIFLFLTKEALDQFRASKGWTAGADAGITVVDVGTGVNLDTFKGKDAIVGFVFGKEGLMGGWSLKGAKFSRLAGVK
jgi:lipid-binding SYLF domain-containing protein